MNVAGNQWVVVQMYKLVTGTCADHDQVVRRARMELQRRMADALDEQAGAVLRAGLPGRGGEHPGECPHR